MNDDDERSRTLDKVALGALVGVGVLAVFQLLTLNQLDTPLKLALYSFAISIPLLSTYLAVLTSATPAIYNSMTSKWSYGLAAFGGGLTGLVGFTAVFWHFSAKLGVLFGGLSLFGLILFVRDGLSGR
jgi:hypothetical protein